MRRQSQLATHFFDRKFLYNIYKSRYKLISYCTRSECCELVIYMGCMSEEQEPHSLRHQSAFHLRDYTNFQNSRYRSAENPKSHHEKTIHDAMVDV